jgi:hypothetical protein
MSLLVDVEYQSELGGTLLRARSSVPRLRVAPVRV